MKRVFLCSIVLLIAVVCSACSGGSAPGYDRAMSSSASQAAEYYPPSADYAAEAEYASPSDSKYGSGGDDSSLPLLTQNDDPGSMMVYEVGLDLQTTSFDEGTRALLTTVREMDGYVVGAHISGRSLYTPDEARWARYTLRIPSEHLADFLVAMEDNYNLWRLDQQSQDIARQHTQTDLNLEYLREQQERLLETLEQTEDAETRMDIERRLRDIQAQIAASTATKDAMEKDVLYSTVTVQLYEVFEQNIPVLSEPEPETFASRFGSTASRSWIGFVAFCQGFLLVLIAILPTIVVLGVIAAAALWVYRLLKKRRSIPFAGKQTRSPADEPPSGDLE